MKVHNHFVKLHKNRQNESETLKSKTLEAQNQIHLLAKVDSNWKLHKQLTSSAADVLLHYKLNSDKWVKASTWPKLCKKVAHSCIIHYFKTTGNKKHKLITSIIFIKYFKYTLGMKTDKGILHTCTHSKWWHGGVHKVFAKLRGLSLYKLWKPLHLS